MRRGSVLFRFALQEPAIVLVSFGLPLLFATECLANLCGETVASVLSVAFDTPPCSCQAGAPGEDDALLLVIRRGSDP